MLCGKPNVSHKQSRLRKELFPCACERSRSLTCSWGHLSNRYVNTGSAAGETDRSFSRVLASTLPFKELPNPAVGCLIAAVGGFQSAEEREKKRKHHDSNFRLEEVRCDQMHETVTGIVFDTDVVVKIFIKPQIWPPNFKKRKWYVTVKTLLGNTREPRNCHKKIVPWWNKEQTWL